MQALRHMRLANCVTAPLTPGVSLLTRLTALEVPLHIRATLQGGPAPPPLPASVRALELSSPDYALAPAQLQQLERLELHAVLSKLKPS